MFLKWVWDKTEEIRIEMKGGFIFSNSKLKYKLEGRDKTTPRLNWGEKIVKVNGYETDKWRMENVLIWIKNWWWHGWEYKKIDLFVIHDDIDINPHDCVDEHLS